MVSMNTPAVMALICSAGPISIAVTAIMVNNRGFALINARLNSMQCMQSDKDSHKSTTDTERGSPASGKSSDPDR
jgi:hypothetical protein